MHTEVVHVKDNIPGAVYIGRGSIWGNPYTHLPLAGTKAQFQVSTRDEAMAKYKEYILSRPDLLAKLHTLKGKYLSCFCRPRKCHGDILVELIERFCNNENH